MNFKVDENLPSEMAELLREAGHDAMTVLDQHLGGEPDAHIAEVCQREGRVLVTLDTDFTNTQAYPLHVHPGFIVLRLRRQDKPYVLSAFRQAIAMLGHEPLEHCLWILEEGRVRIRGPEAAQGSP